jgi:hypothetical protein
MKTLSILLSLAFLASAQQAPPDDATLRKLKAEVETMVAQSKNTVVKGAVMNATVKGAPYSGVEITESTQVLADGTRIHNETSTSVFRDSEGRVRRETPEQITIMDPVAGATWFLDPKSQTAHKAPLGSTGNFFFRTATGATGSTNVMEFHSVTREGVTTSAIMPPDGKLPPPPPLPMAGGATVMYKRLERPGPGETESLGKQTLEGVAAEGTRTTFTMPVGAIGNDRPIKTVSERWYSADLQTVMMSTHSDPRTGDETFRLTNVSRTEPGTYLFQVPAGYQVMDNK